MEDEPGPIVRGLPGVFQPSNKGSPRAQTLPLRDDPYLEPDSPAGYYHVGTG